MYRQAEEGAVQHMGNYGPRSTNWETRQDKSKTWQIINFLTEVAEMHQFQPNREWTILSYTLRRDVYDVFMTTVYGYDKLSDAKPPCSYQHFLKVWKKRVKQVVVRATMTFVLCTVCCDHHRVMRETHWQEKEIITASQSLWRAHLTFVEQERAAYQSRKRAAIKFPNDYLSLTLDGADQGCFKLPWFSTKTKRTASWYKLRQYLTGVIVHGRALLLLHHLPLFSHGANLTIECMHHTFSEVFRREKKLPDVCHIQLDNWCVHFFGCSILIFLFQLEGEQEQIRVCLAS